MRLQEKIRGQRIARQRGGDDGGWVSHLMRAGNKVEDDLPVPQQTGFVGRTIEPAVGNSR